MRLCGQRLRIEEVVKAGMGEMLFGKGGETEGGVFVRGGRHRGRQGDWALIRLHVDMLTSGRGATRPVSRQ